MEAVTSISVQSLRQLHPALAAFRDAFLLKFEEHSPTWHAIPNQIPATLKYQVQNEPEPSLLAAIETGMTSAQLLEQINTIIHHFSVTYKELSTYENHTVHAQFQFWGHQTAPRTAYLQVLVQIFPSFDVTPTSSLSIP